jgi:dihydrodipicolinate synthase/N-acetylneuraminate lyase
MRSYHGQTGEGLLQPIEERKRVAEVAVKDSPAGKQVIIHTGAYRTADAVELTRPASRIGATAVSSLPPLGAYSFAEIREYYKALAAAFQIAGTVLFLSAGLLLHIPASAQGTESARNGH